MKHAFASLVIVLGCVSSFTAMAQQMTVSSLLKEGYEISGIIPSNAGPGIFLKKGDTLIVCFVAETAGSPVVQTQYCKPVR